MCVLFDTHNRDLAAPWGARSAERGVILESESWDIIRTASFAV